MVLLSRTTSSQRGDECNVLGYFQTDLVYYGQSSNAHRPIGKIANRVAGRSAASRTAVGAVRRADLSLRTRTVRPYSRAQSALSAVHSVSLGAHGAKCKLTDAARGGADVDNHNGLGVIPQGVL
jgi:hypothetical protein